MRTGNPAIQCAIEVINPAGIRITAMMIWVIQGAIEESKAAMNPKTVIGATTGAAKRFATTLMGAK